MSHQEKRNLAGLASLLITSGAYALIIFQRYQALGLDTTNDLRFWGVAIVTLLPVLFISQLLGYIIFIIANSLITKEKSVTIEDELDKLIDLKAISISFYIFTLGVIASVGLLIFGLPPRAVFISIAISLIIASVMAFVSKMIHYKRGVI